jgi:ring-1,2-phenylacetyl-CoA epoxidase subunit PaaB
MTDQWPRYEVFKQDRPDGPFRNVGSVHAPDAELALMNARDVFARRPACHSLWVIPAAAILTRTAEELAGEQRRRGPDRSRGAGGQGSSVRGEVAGSVHYAVFIKQSERQAMTYVDYVGQVEARAPEEALHLAVAAYNGPPGVVWWICAASVIVRSDPDEEAGFAAATGKLFRLPNQYRTVFTMQKIKRGEGEEG